jgi:hypothetical protein
VPNAGQENNDLDAQGDACDLDDDNDTVLDTVDNCPLVANPSQANHDADAMGDACDPDDDNDGVADAQDCAPEDASAAIPPVEVGGLTVSRTGGTSLSWTSQGAGFRYDVAGGSLATLRANGNVAAATCLANDQATPTWPDPRPDPAAGSGYYYLSRAQNACGSGTYGNASSGAERLPAAACP